VASLLLSAGFGVYIMALLIKGRRRKF